MQLILVTGMSGAGKALAARVFEDIGYTVVDNLPPVLLPELVEKCVAIGSQPPGEWLAVVVDVRSGSFFVGITPALELIRERGVRPVTLFLDAADAVLVQRFKETRRKHPLFHEHGGILGSIHAERALLVDLKEIADKVIDTSEMGPHDLRNQLMLDFAPDRDIRHSLTVTITSFGFKFGLPLDADLVFDVRFLANPHYVEDLRLYDGRNQLVADYVNRDPNCAAFSRKLNDLLQFSIPQYMVEGKAYLTVAIGCTGGRHRSVVIAEKLGGYLKKHGHRVLVQHRDVGK
jgi:UPF0042 nucleotide-binding protein